MLKTEIDIDFYVPDEGLVVQVAYAIGGEAHKREVTSLAKLAKSQAMKRLVIVTKQERETIREDGATIEVISAHRFLLECAS